MNGKTVLTLVEKALVRYKETSDLANMQIENVFRHHGGLYLITNNGTKFRISVSKEPT